MVDLAERAARREASVKKVAIMDMEVRMPQVVETIRPLLQMELLVVKRTRTAVHPTLQGSRIHPEETQPSPNLPTSQPLSGRIKTLLATFKVRTSTRP